MNNLKKRCLTLLLSLAMIVTYMPTSMIAYAVDNPDQPEVEATAPEAEETSDDAVSKDAAAEDVASEEVTSSEEVAEPADEPAEESVEEPKEDANTEATGEDTEEEFGKDDLTAKEGPYEVIVSYGEKAKIPEGAKLKLTVFGENDKAFKEAKEALIADENSNSAFSQATEEEQKDLGMAAFDLTIYDKDGGVVEPQSEVSVSFKLKELPEGVDAETLAASMEIQHLNESSGDVVVEKIATVDSREAANDKAVGEVVVNENKETAETKTVVDGFSTYTITWSNNQARTTVHYGYMDGNNFVEFDKQPTPVNISRDYRTYLIYDFDDYEYSGYTYYRTSASSTPASGGTRIQAQLRYSSSNWRYHAYSTDASNNNWNNIANNSHIYVVYDKKPDPTAGGTPSALDDASPSDWPQPEGDETPVQFTKSSTHNTNGTNTVTLDINGKEGDYEKSTKANVIVVFDVSGSMDENLGNQTRLARAKAAVNSMANTLLNGNIKGVKMALISFSTTSSATPVQGFTDSYSTYRSAVNGLSADGGTNWEQALYNANRLSVDPDAATYVVFVTDGDPTYRLSRYGAPDSEIQGYNRDNRYFEYDIFGAGSSDPNNRNFDAAAKEVSSILSNNKTFYAIGVSSDVTKVQNLVDEAGGGTAYLATDSDALDEAFAEITQSIRTTLGFGDVQITDGITELANVEMKVMQDVDPDSFTYYKVTSSGATPWDPASEGAGLASYNKQTGAVVWNLGPNFQLEDGVTYRVTFRAWPSQAAYDLVADLNNGVKVYEAGHSNSITAEERKQVNELKAPTIVEGVTTEPGQYTLKTNTDTINATYKRTSSTGGTVAVADNTPITASYHPGTIENMGLDSEKLTVKKIFDQSLDPRTVDQVTLKLQRMKNEAGEEMADYNVPGTTSPNIVLNNDNEWSYSFYVAPGFIVDGETLETGYKFTVTEPDLGENTVRYDLIPEIVNPMVVDGTLQLIGDGDNNQQLTAINRTRSAIEIHKTLYDVDGRTEIYPDTEFTITGQLLGPDGTPYTSQETAAPVAYYLYDKDGNATTGRLHFPDSSDISFTLKAGEFLRFVNVPEGCTFEFQESSMPDNYELKDLAAVGRQRGDEDPAYTYSIILSDEEAHLVETATTIATTDEGIIGNTNYKLDFNNKRVIPLPEVELIKVDAEDNEIKVNGAGFSLYDGDRDNGGKPVTTDGNGNPINILTGDKEGSEGPDGWYHIGTLPAGTYYLYETVVPDTHVLNETPVIITVAQSGTSYTVRATQDGESVITGPTDGLYTITVDNERSTTKVEGTKTWTDNNAAGVTSILVQLMRQVIDVATGAVVLDDDGNPMWEVAKDANGADIAEKGVDEDDQWKYSFENVPKYITTGAGTLTEIVYKVVETKVFVDGTTETTGYEATGGEKTVDEEGNESYDLVNTPKAYNLTVNKSFSGVESLPANFKITVSYTDKDGNAATATLTADERYLQDDGTYSWPVNGVRYATEVTAEETNYGVQDYGVDTAVDVTGATKKSSSSATKAVIDMPDSNDAEITFTNTYKNAVLDTKVEFFKKTVSAANPTSSATFSFNAVEVTDETGGTVKPNGWSSNNKSVTYAAKESGPKNVDFGTITYTAAGTYYYKVTESATLPAGWKSVPDTAAGKTAIVTVVVTGNAKDGFTTEVTEGTITNAYSVGSTTATFPVVKELVIPEGLEGPEEWSYDVTAEAASDNAEATVTDTSVVEGTVDQDTDTVTFGPFTYTAAGTYTYTVSETGTVAGVTNDAEASGKTVTVEVVDNGDGTLTATVSGADSTEEAVVNTTTFTNFYNVGSTTASFPVVKELVIPEGLEGPEEWSYDVTAEAASDNAEATVTDTSVVEGTVDQDHDTVTFGPFTYTAPGTYTYTVSEDGDIDGVENDAEASGKTVTVEVVDNGDGTLNATPSSTAGSTLTFTNTYSVDPTTASFPVRKFMSVPEDLDGPASWTYEINVRNNGNAPAASPMTKQVTKTADTATFGAFTFNKPGTYTYTVTESPVGTYPGVTNDAAATTGKTVTITVVDNGDGTLTATPDFTEGKPLTFTNVYGTEPVPVETSAYLKKKVDSMPPKTESATFNFTLVEKVEGAEPLTATVTATRAGTYDIDFGTLTYTKPGTHTYTLTEVLDGLNGGWVVEGSPVDVTVTVTDDGKGGLVAEVSNYTITNKFDTVVVSGEKTWDDDEYFDEEGNPINGYERPEIEINLLADGTKIDSVKIKKEGKDEKWTYEFTDLPKFKDHGTEIVYTVTETDVDGFTAEVPEGSYDVVNTPEREEDDDLNETSLTLKKVDSVTGETIPTEATFVLKKGSETKEYKTENGTVTIPFSKESGNVQGTYTLQEKVQPTGYVLSDKTYTITVDKKFNHVEIKESVWHWIYDLLFDDETEAQFDEATQTLTIPNTPVPTDITAVKVWNDNNNKDGDRPDSITLTLKGVAAGEEVYTSTRTITEKEQWKTEWNDLVTYINGKEITYSITEAEVEGYTTDPITLVKDDDGNYSAIVKNNHQSEPEKTVYVGTDTTVINGQEVQPGDKLTYTINYTNSNGKDVTATITDKIPAHTTFDSASDGVTPDESGMLTWTKEVKDGESVSVSFSVIVDENVNGAELTNTGHVRDGVTDPSTNEVVNPTPSDPVKDVFDVKDDTTSIDGDVVEAGQRLLYKITYKNTTGKDADVVITDKIPDNTTFISADNGGEDKSGTVTWNLHVENGKEVTVSFIVEVVANDGTSVDNQAFARVGKNSYDTNETTNPTGTDPVKDVFDAGDTTTSIDGKPVKPGQELTYTITYTNTTGKDVTAEITDTIPTYTTYKEGSATYDGKYEGGKVSWSIKVAKDAKPVTVSFTVIVDEDVSGEAVVNDAKVKVGKNNYDTNEVTNPTPPAKTVYSGTSSTEIDGKPVKPGDVLRYEIKYTNPTKETVDATITDKIPTHTTYVDGSISEPGKVSGDNLTWNVKVGPGASVTVSFQVKVDDDVSGETLTNESTVKYGDNEYTSNETSNPTPPKKEVFTGGSKTNIDGQDVVPGQELTYQITFTNSKDKAVEAIITDTIPEFTTYVDGSADNDGTFADGKVTWKKTVEPGKTLTVSFKVKVNATAAGEELTNTAIYKEGENGKEIESNPVTNPVTYELTISKDLTDYVDNGEIEAAAFAFEITGKYVDENGEEKDYKNTIGMEFTKKSDVNQEIVVKGIPSTIKDLQVKEVYAGNYKADDDTPEITAKGKNYLVKFVNTKSDHEYKGGVVNNYAKDSNGEYKFQGGDTASPETNE